ncbi:MAG: acyltransferase [Dolichospermum sp. DET50]|nr:acyltransferase [Dolichospermum sp. DET66]MBS3032022.1 acyltransferase [Dolichospermum sp. DET67]MBS3037231.1 acyltransferase [Dolichospermum sp. DET50]QSX69220.1 MAG: acyltransferase [Dolichospermum sp. DET69]
MFNKQRLLGIDLLRGLAAFAVIVVHSGDETWGVSVSYWALQFRLFFYFAVPFFLATSFFFTTRKLGENISLQFLLAKFQRIFIPYTVWSIFYIVLGIIIFPLIHQSHRINELFQDPFAIIFFGGASYHLYFLPLLFSGTLLVFLLDNLVKHRSRIKIMAFLSIVGIIVNYLIAWSGNSFNLGSHTAFTSLLSLMKPNTIEYLVARFLLVQIVWILICLPYFCLAVVLNHLLLKVNSSVVKSRSTILLFLCIFIVVNTLGKVFIASEVSNIIIAFSLLFVGICLSSQIKESKIIKDLGNCSFGIYLIHPIIKKTMGIILTFAVPQVTSQVTVMSMLCFSIPSFFISWLVVSLLMKNKHFAKYIFGN